MAGFTLDMGEVHDLSLGLLEYFEEEEVQSNRLAVGALIMTVGRLMSAKPLEEDQESDFLKAMLDFAGCYFAGGGLN